MLLRGLRYSLVVQDANIDGLYGVHCPALDGHGACTAAGTSIGEAIANGVAAVNDFVESLVQRGITPPRAERFPEVRIVSADVPEVGYERIVRSVRTSSGRVAH